MSDDLVAFLRARLDEDEQDSVACGGRDWRWLGTCVVDSDVDGWRSAPDAAVLVTLRWDREDLGPHIARHDPARVLREVEAKRRILELHQRAEDAGESVLWNGSEWATIVAYETALKVLALPYADHPDYRDEWQP